MAASKMLKSASALPSQPKQNAQRRKSELVGYRQIIPCAQGDLDYLCGVYSIINAVRLVMQPIKPVSKSKSRALFEDSIEFLRQHASLDPALTNGISIKRWKQLAVFVAARAGTAEWSIDVQTTNRRMLERTIVRCITDSLECGWPVLLHLGRDQQHFTVIAGITPQSVMLFDSNERVRVKRECFVERHDITSRMMRLTLHARD
jgi:hypothetical protein